MVWMQGQHCSLYEPKICDHKLCDEAQGVVQHNEVPDLQYDQTFAACERSTFRRFAKVRRISESGRPLSRVQTEQT